MSNDTPVKKILILAANPKGTSPLRLDEEVREIDAGLRRARKREEFLIESRWAVRTRDLQRAMLDVEPQIVHFSGHGSGVEGLVLEDETGQVKLVDAEGLAELFELFAKQVECLVLNACYSEIQAEAIAQHINYVIGMNQAIGDRAAIEFAVAFYDALGAGRPVEFAYKLGCAAIRLAGIPEQLNPSLKKKPNLNPTPAQPHLPENHLEREIFGLRNEDIAPIEERTIYVRKFPITNCYRLLPLLFEKIARPKNKVLVSGAILSISAFVMSAIYTQLWLPELWLSPPIKVNVKGGSDPWLAGMPDKSEASICKNLVSDGRHVRSIAPKNSPTEVKGIRLISGSYLTFTVKGEIAYFNGDNGGSKHEPEGKIDLVVTHDTGEQNGISDVKAPMASLLGVFLGAEQPNKGSTPPQSENRQNDFIIHPKLQQVFFIGDGRTYMGIKQRVIVPPGAKRFYLGTMDGCGWEDNIGSFDVEVTSSAG